MPPVRRGDLESRRRAPPRASKPAPRGFVPRASNAPPPPKEASQFSVLGNRATVWDEVLRLVRHGTAVVIAIRGPSGTGKTLGATEAARACRRRCVHYDCPDLAATREAVQTFCGDLKVASTRAGLDGDGKTPLVLLDDADKLAPDLVTELLRFFRERPSAHGPVVLTFGRDCPPWLNADVRQRCGVRTFATAPLPPDDLKELARASRLPPGVTRPPPHILQACLGRCQGDARCFVNLLRLYQGADESCRVGDAAERRRQTLGEWDTARRLLFADVDDAELQHVLQTSNLPLLFSIVHANYLQAVSRANPHSTAEAYDFDKVCARVDLLSSAETMRMRDSRQPSAAGHHLMFGIARGMGHKGKSAGASLERAPRPGAIKFTWPVC